MTYPRRVLLGRGEEISLVPPLPRSMWQHKVQNNEQQVEMRGPRAERQCYFATWFLIPSSLAVHVRRHMQHPSLALT